MTDVRTRLSAVREPSSSPGSPRELDGSMVEGPQAWWSAGAESDAAAGGAGGERGAPPVEIVAGRASAASFVVAFVGQVQSCTGSSIAELLVLRHAAAPPARTPASQIISNKATVLNAAGKSGISNTSPRFRFAARLRPLVALRCRRCRRRARSCSAASSAA